jgi:hypothetical protein
MPTHAYSFSILGCDIDVSDQQIKFSDPNVLAGHGGTLAVSSGFTISNGPVHIFGDDDDAVVRKYALRTQTSGNQVSEFRLDYPNGLSGVPVREEHTYIFQATIVGKTQDSQIPIDCAMFKIKGLLVDDALGLEVVEPYTVDNVYRFSSSLGVSATGIKQNDEELLQIQVTGVAGKNINWVAGLDLVEIGGTTTNPYGRGRTSLNAYNNYNVGEYCIIIRQPNNFVDSSGTDPSFFCSGITNSGDITYQWEYRYNGDPDEDTEFKTIVGATGLTYEPPESATAPLFIPTSSPNGHSTAYPNEFRCVVSSTNGETATSRPVTWMYVA